MFENRPSGSKPSCSDEGPAALFGEQAPVIEKLVTAIEIATAGGEQWLLTTSEPLASRDSPPPGKRDETPLVSKGFETGARSTPNPFFCARKNVPEFFEIIGTKSGPPTFLFTGPHLDNAPVGFLEFRREKGDDPRPREENGIGRFSIKPKLVRYCIRGGGAGPKDQRRFQAWIPQ